MLTKREYEQLKIAFEAMQSVKVNTCGSATRNSTGEYICRESVIAILARWVDFGEREVGTKEELDD